MSRHILIYGQDPTLLLTRTLVLEHAGFRVKAVHEPSSLLGSSGECLLLCSTVSETEQLEVIRLMRMMSPAAKILVVGEDHALEGKDVLRMSAFAGAEDLIENARLLLQ